MIANLHPYHRGKPVQPRVELEPAREGAWLVRLYWHDTVADDEHYAGTACGNLPELAGWLERRGVRLNDPPFVEESP